MFNIGDRFIYTRRSSYDPVPDRYMGRSGTVVKVFDSWGNYGTRYSVTFDNDNDDRWLLFQQEMEPEVYPESEEG